MTTVSEMNVRIGATITDFQKKMGEVTKGMEGASSKMKATGESMKTAGGKMSKMVTGPMVAVGAGMLALAKKTGNYADEVLDLQAITGMSTDSIQEWQHVAKVAGVSTNSMTTASEQLTKQMSTMADGTGKQAEALAGLGIEYKDLEAASPDERMNMLTQALSEVEDDAKRAEYGTDLLRGSWKEIAPVVSMGADAIDDAKNRAHELGTVMGEDALSDANNFRISMDELGAQMAGVGRNIMSDLMPVIQGSLMPFIEDTLVPGFQRVGEIIGEVIEWFMGLSPTVLKIIGIFMLVMAALGPLLIVFGFLASAIGSILSLTTLLAPVFAALKVAFLAITGPIGIIIGIVILLAVLIFKYWDEIKEFTITVFSAIGDFFMKVWNLYISIVTGYIKLVISAVKAAWDWIKKTTMTIFSAIGSFFSSIWSTYVSIIKGYINIVLSIIKTVWNGIKSTTESVFNGIKSFFDTIFSGIGSAAQKFADVFGKVWDSIKEGAKAISAPIAGVLNGIMAGIEAVVNGIAGAINKLPSFDIPNWVPVVGGNKFGLPNIPTISLPRVPSFDVGTNVVPNDMLAQIHKGEMIVPKKFNPALSGMSEGNDTSILEEIRDELRKQKGSIIRIEGDNEAIRAYVNEQNALDSHHRKF
ncbi:hypothetical protein QGM71_01310 [Virgibacillus sp. C22-A2]|uniref:Phage tail tape measure protein n=1 Tax=Virgibacillus tibetensis TaxID=3042313 RepID=A0ABU6KB43_9BACI|nr:hypothetical protein [Virgibacillus sp. C22-A2]